MAKRKIYVASSWRNERQPDIVAELRKKGHEVYDFKNPGTVHAGFSWSDVDPNWKNWTPTEFRNNLWCVQAQEGFARDWENMMWADTCVIVMPCGRSAHLEAGYFVGAGKRLFILLSDGEPELMYRMADYVCVNMKELFEKMDLADHNDAMAKQ